MGVGCDTLGMVECPTGSDTCAFYCAGGTSCRANEKIPVDVPCLPKTNKCGDDYCNLSEGCVCDSTEGTCKAQQDCSVLQGFFCGDITASGTCSEDGTGCPEGVTCTLTDTCAEISCGGETKEFCLGSDIGAGIIGSGPLDCNAGNMTSFTSCDEINMVECPPGSDTCAPYCSPDGQCLASQLISFPIPCLPKSNQCGNNYCKITDGCVCDMNVGECKLQQDCTELQGLLCGDTMPMGTCGADGTDCPTGVTCKLTPTCAEITCDGVKKEFCFGSEVNPGSLTDSTSGAYLLLKYNAATMLWGFVAVAFAVLKQSTW